MRHNKIFRTLALAVILSLLVIAIPAVPALAQYEEIYVSPTSGEVGDDVTVSGSYFDVGRVYIYFSSYDADYGDYVDDLDAYEEVLRVNAVGSAQHGVFDEDFAVPAELTDGATTENVSKGTYYVYATYDREGEIVALDSFTITVTAAVGEIALDPEEGTVGTKVKISGLDFGKSEAITIQYDGVDISIASGAKKTGTGGKFTCTIIIPESVAGDHTITVTDESGNEAEAQFTVTVEPKMTVSPTSGSVGDRVTVSGTGFAETEDVTITIGGYPAAKGETDEYGSFTTMFIVPAAGTTGANYLKAEDESGNTATAEFTIAIDFVVTPTTGNVGTKIKVSGTGFSINRQVTIAYDDKEIATTPADSRGAFSASFDAPVSLHGNHQIVASDGTNRMTLTFTMESTLPATPAPLLPEMGVKAEALAHFDWEDVTDPSGVTYTLQIATDEDFSKDSIVLEKAGLTKSEYTIPEKDKLLPTKKEAPYYWRVKAIDAASNESLPTGVGEFYVGAQWPGMKGWPTYVLMVIVGVVILLVGFLVGRKTSYSA